MRSRKCLNGSLAGLVSLALLAGCGGDGPAPEAPGTELRSDKQRISAPDVAPADLALQVRGNTAFALDVYHQLGAAGDGNLFFSPHSIEVALAMTWAGARGQTETDMAAALRFELPQERLHPVFNQIDLELARRGEGAEGADGKAFRLNVVNAIWGQTGYSFLDAFLDVLAENYGAGLRLMDFVADPAGAAQAINDWVAAVTEGRIEELIPPSALSEYTKLVLVNAIYFNAAWASPFEPAATAAGPFATGAGQTVSVPMMHQEFETGFYLGDGFTAVELAYDGFELSMLVLVPDPGLALSTLEARLDTDLLAQVASGLDFGIVDLTMPRWELDGETVSLVEVLGALGMDVAFTPAADFSGMNGTGDLMIHDVLHQAFVKVDEAGTEAAAATAVIVGDTSVPPQGPTVVLDRPFVYLIQDRPTGQVLFLGRVSDPR
jgi:serpin B